MPLSCGVRLCGGRLVLAAAASLARRTHLHKGGDCTTYRCVTTSANSTAEAGPRTLTGFHHLAGSAEPTLNTVISDVIGGIKRMIAIPASLSVRQSKELPHSPSVSGLGGARSTGSRRANENLRLLFPPPSGGDRGQSEWTKRLEALAGQGVVSVGRKDGALFYQAGAATRRAN